LKGFIDYAEADGQSLSSLFCGVFWTGIYRLFVSLKPGILPVVYFLFFDPIFCQGKCYNYTVSSVVCFQGTIQLMGRGDWVRGAAWVLGGRVGVGLLGRGQKCCLGGSIDGYYML
jgi:hypothetical protein